jgi:DNA repair protein SbcD/Mre11
VRILLTGDLHLGRSSSSVGGGCAGHRAADAWEHIVDLAIERGVFGVVMSGDVVDQSNRFFEATGPLSQGLRRLAAKGIGTVAVAGNHDHSVLPALAQQYGGPEFRFTLLGRGGAWEHHVVSDNGSPALRLVGWSFPAESCTTDPLQSFPSNLPTDLPVLGLVHGDLDAGGSRYAPLSGSALKAKPVGGWLLGHIHAPRRDSQPGIPWLLYPGSPQALDPGERGPHGVWIAEVTPTAVNPPTQVALSSVRYESVAVDVTPATDDLGLRLCLRDRLRSAADDARQSGGESLSQLVIDLVIEGATPVAASVDPVVEELRDARELDTRVAVELRDTHNRVTLPLDIDGLARGKTLPGKLASLVIELEAGRNSESANDAMAGARRAVSALTFMSQIKEGDGESTLKLSEDALRLSLATAARKLLASLVAAGQPPAGGGSR